MGCLYMHQKVRSFLIISINATFAIISSFLFLCGFFSRNKMGKQRRLLEDEDDEDDEMLPKRMSTY